MDRIEQLMKDAKPRGGMPGTAPGSESARSIVSSTDPNLVRMAGRAPARRNTLSAATATLAAAAAVVAAAVVGGNLMSQPSPGPAQTGIPTPAISATPAPTSSGAPTASSAPATPAPATSAAATLSTGGVACTMANVDEQRNDQVRAIKAVPAAERHYYTVLGCADGWLAYSISGEGIRALQLDGGNAWYKIARLQSGRFLCDVRQDWSSVFNWEFQATNNQGLTAQQAMDKEFAAKGIPVKLRPQLVGDGPAAG